MIGRCYSVADTPPSQTRMTWHIVRYRFWPGYWVAITSPGGDQQRFCWRLRYSSALEVFLMEAHGRMPQYNLSKRWFASKQGA